MRTSYTDYVISNYRDAYDIDLRRLSTLSDSYSKYGVGLNGAPFILITCSSKRYEGGYFFRISDRNGLEKNHIGSKRLNRETNRYELVWEKVII